MKHIELWAAGPHLYLDDFTPPMVDALGAEIKKRNLEVVCLTPEQCAYPINIGAEEDYIRERSVRYFIKAIHVAASLQASNVLVTPGNGYRNKDNTETWVYTLESLQRLSLEAEKSNITLFLEHLTQETTNIAVSARELAKLWKDANCDNIIPMVDTDMMSRENEDIEDYFVATVENIGHVHFVDGLPGGHLALGDGNLPLEKYLKSLDVHRYRGFISLEIMNEKYLLEPKSHIERSIHWLKNHIR